MATIRRLGTAVTNTTIASTGTQSFSYTVPAGSNRMVVCFVTTSNASQFPIVDIYTGATINGSPATGFFETTVYAGVGSASSKFAYFYWLEADIDTGTVVITDDASLTFSGRNAIIVTYENVEQTAPSFTSHSYLGNDVINIASSTVPQTNAIIQGKSSYRQSTGTFASANFNLGTDAARTKIGYAEQANGSDSGLMLVDSMASATGASDNDLATIYSTNDAWNLGTNQANGDETFVYWMELVNVAPPPYIATAVYPDSGFSPYPMNTGLVAGDLIIIINKITSSWNGLASTSVNIDDLKVYGHFTQTGNGYLIETGRATGSAANISPPSTGFTSAIAYGVRNADNFRSAISSVTSTATDPNPPSLTLPESLNALWLADTNASPTVVPSGYTAYHGNDNAEKTLEATTEDPGVFTAPTSIHVVTTSGIWDQSAILTQARPFFSLADVSGLGSTWGFIKTGISSGSVSNVNSFVGLDGFSGSFESGISNGTEDGYWRWRGTFADLGVTANHIVKSIAEPSIDVRVRSTTDGLTYFGDDDGSGGALELIHDWNGSPTSHVLIADQSAPASAESVFSNVSPALSLTSLSYAQADDVELRIHVHLEGTNNNYILFRNLSFEMTTEFLNPGDIVSTTTAVSTVSGTFNRTVPLAATVAAVSTVSATPLRTRALASTTTATTSLISKFNKAAFPTVVSRTPGFAATATSHAITVPTHNDGDHLVVLFNWNSTSFIDINTPGSFAAGWRTSGYRRDIPSSGAVFSKVATDRDSDLNTLTVNLAATQPASWVVFVIRNGKNIASAGIEGTSNSYATLDLAKDKSVLWISCHSSGSAISGQLMTAPQTNYTNLTTADPSVASAPFTQTTERELYASSETPPDAVTVDSGFDQLGFTIAVWGNEAEEVTKTFSFGDYFYDTDGWVFTEVRTSGAGSIGSGGSAVENFGFGDLSGMITAGAGFPTDGVVSDSYWEWTGTFEDLGVRPSSTIIGYSEASIYYNYRFYADPIATFIGDNLGSRGAFSIDDGTVRTLIGNQPDPGTSGALFRASDTVAVTGLVLPAQTPFTMRVTMHVDSVAASGGNATPHFDEFSLTSFILPGWETTDVAIESPAFVVQGRPYPIVTDTATTTVGVVALGASFAVNMPTHTAGQLLIVVLGGIDNAFSYVDKDVWPNNLHLINNFTNVWWKVAETSSETCDIFCTGDPSFTRASVIAYAVDNAKYVEGRGDAKGGDGSTSDVEILTTGVVKPTMWMTIRGQNSATVSDPVGGVNYPARDPTGPPPGYTDLILIPEEIDVTYGLASATWYDNKQVNIAATWPDDWFEGIVGTDSGFPPQLITLALYDNIDATDDSITLTAKINFPMHQDYKGFNGLPADANDRYYGFGLEFYGTVEADWDVGTGPSYNSTLWGTETSPGGGIGGMISRPNVKNAYPAPPAAVQTDQISWIWQGTLEDLGVPVGHAVKAFRNTTIAVDGSQSGPSFSEDQSSFGLLYYNTPVALRVNYSYDNRSPQYLSLQDGYWDRSGLFGSPVSLNIGTAELPLMKSNIQAGESWSDLEILMDYTNVAAVLFDPATEIAVETPDLKIVVEVKPTVEEIAVESPNVHIILEINFDPATEIAVEAVAPRVAKSARLISTTNVVSTVSGQPFEVLRDMATTVAVVSTVNGNIVEDLRVMTSVIAQSAVINADLVRAVPLVTEIIVAATVSGILFSFASSIAVTSNVTANLEVARDMNTTVAATSTASAALDREPNFATIVTSLSTLTAGGIGRDIAFDTTVAAQSTVTPFFTSDPRFIATVAVQSGASATLDRQPKFVTPIVVTSNVNGNIVEGLRFISTSVVQSAIINAQLNRAVGYATALAAASNVVTSINRNPGFATVIAATSTSSATMVVITNTLELTFTETYFTEISPFVIQLVSDNVDFVVIVNELDEITLPTTELLADVTITTTTDDGPA